MLPSKRSASADGGEPKRAKLGESPSAARVGTSNGTRNGAAPEIDEDLHSRQLAVYGRETMRRLFAADVLVSGLDGLGAEIGSFRLHPLSLVVLHFQIHHALSESTPSSCCQLSN
jgi:ubiquitin-activating enzyme E1